MVALKKRRHLSIWTAASFIIASMIGTGVFTSLGYQLVDIQSIFPLIMLWVVGGIIALCGALSYSELATIYPRSGGEYHLLSIIIHPSIGFAAGIVSATVGFTAPSVLASMALGNYLSPLIPFIDPIIIALVVIISIHTLHMTNFRWGIIFQDSFTLVKIGLIIFFIIFGFFVENNEQISIIPSIGDIKIILSPEFAISLIWVSYAYTGWNSSVYIAGEIEDPKVNIPKSMIVATMFVTALYILLNYIFLYTTPIDLMVGKVEVGYIAGQQIFGRFGGKLISLGISILLLSTVSSYVYIGPRIMHAMGEDHAVLGILSSKNAIGIPIKSFWIQLIISIIFILTSTFEQVLLYAGISLIITTVFTVIALFVLRITEPNLNRRYKVVGFPIIPILYLMLNGWILYFSFQRAFIESVIGCVIFIIGVVLYFISRKLG
ncbi:MAG: APC family permease [Candidatus Neomarinimicrobiota bacterium]